MTCPQCSTETPENAHFCPSCGLPLSDKPTNTCTSCGAEFYRAVKFCDNCGTYVGGIDSGSTSLDNRNTSERMLDRLGPREYIQHLMVDGNNRIGERRTVTTLFADVVGSTAMAEKLDPEIVAEIMNGAFKVLTEPVIRYEGTLARLMGDAILSLFGAPTAHEDDPVRACRAALEIIKNAGEFEKRLRRERGLDSFKIRVGITTGPVFVGEVGTDVRAEYTAIGDAVNLAARLESAASPGTILISGDTWNLVKNVFEGKDMGLLEVKGKTRPVHVFRLIRLKQKTTEEKQRHIHSPFVGRDDELNILRKTFSNFTAGQRGIISITGETGIGKSRLLDEARSIIPAGTMTVEGKCLSYTRGMDYWIIRDIIYGLIGVDIYTPPSQVGHVLRTSIKNLLKNDNQAGNYLELSENSEFVEISAPLGHLLHIALEKSEKRYLASLGARQLQIQIRTAFIKCISLIAKQHPLILIWEDIHWIDDQSFQILEELLSILADYSVLLLFTYRPKTGPGSDLDKKLRNSHSNSYRSISLKRLDQHSCTELLYNLLDNVEISDQITKPILNIADGNPFFLEEILRAHIEAGLIDEDGKPHSLQLTDIPRTVEGAILSRVDHLKLKEKKVLQAAAVMGRSFYRNILVQVVGSDISENDFNDALDVLQSKEFILPIASFTNMDTQTSTAGRKTEPAVSNVSTQLSGIINLQAQSVPDKKLVFKHALTAEVIYNSLLKSSRRELHKKVGETLESLFPGRLDDIAPILVHHYERADIDNRTLFYLMKAAKQASKVFALDKAVRRYKKALMLIEKESAGHADNSYLVTALEGLGDTCYLMSKYEKALDSYSRALQVEKDPRRRASLYRKQGELLEKWGRYETARESFEQGLAEIKTDLEEYEAARIYSGLSLVYCHLQDLKTAKTLGERALDMMQKIKDSRGIAQACNNLGIILSKNNQWRLSEKYYHKCHSIWEEMGNDYGLASCRNNLGRLSLKKGDFKKALEHFQESLKMFETLNNQHGLARVYDNMGNTLHLMGRQEEAYAFIEKAVKILAEIGAEQNGLQPEVWQSGVW